MCSSTIASQHRGHAKLVDTISGSTEFPMSNRIAVDGTRGSVLTIMATDSSRALPRVMCAILMFLVTARNVSASLLKITFASGGRCSGFNPVESLGPPFTRNVTDSFSFFLFRFDSRDLSSRKSKD